MNNKDLLIKEEMDSLLKTFHPFMHEVWIQTHYPLFSEMKLKLTASLLKIYESGRKDPVMSYALICSHEWTDCPGGICTSEVHNAHCRLCSKHAVKTLVESKDTELIYINGDTMLEGDKVELEYMRQGGGVMPDKVKGVITYKNGAFYIVGDDFEKTISSILENNAQVPEKYPININKII